MTLKKRFGDPAWLFDRVLSRAYDREQKRGKKFSEPRFVRELISTRTIDRLNRAAKVAYDKKLGQVYFRGGYLHGRPYARFDASWSAGAKWTAGSKKCSRELADALLVVYETRPAPGALHHQVVRRAACMLMFKRDDSPWPETLRFSPGVDRLPSGKGNGDKEQFYLYNRWPLFSLEEGSVAHPTFQHGFRLSGTVTHDIGKFALVWSGSATSNWTWWNWPGYRLPARWLYADPVPGQQIMPPMLAPGGGSLGHLLEGLIDASLGSGRDFIPVPWPPASSAHPYGWDELMAFLLGYTPPSGSGAPKHAGHLAGGTYYGQSRDVNPAGMQFLMQTGDALGHAAVEMGSLLQPFEKDPHLLEGLDMADAHDRVYRSNRDIYPKGAVSFQRRQRHNRGGGGKGGLPVIVAMVHHFTPREEEPLRRTG